MQHPDEGYEQAEQKTSRLLRDLDESGILPEGITGSHAVNAVLCTLTKRLTRDEAEDFARSVPPTLRALLTACVEHRDDPPERLDRATFLRRVADHLGIETDRAAHVSRAVFRAVRAVLPPEELESVEAELPYELGQLLRE